MFIKTAAVGRQYFSSLYELQNLDRIVMWEKHWNEC